MSWRRRAACLEVPTSDFYDVRYPELGLRWCARCPVVGACRSDDLRAAGSRFDVCGVRGGLDERERRRLWSRAQHRVWLCEGCGAPTDRAVFCSDGCVGMGRVAV